MSGASRSRIPSPPGVAAVLSWSGQGYHWVRIRRSGSVLTVQDDGFPLRFDVPAVAGTVGPDLTAIEALTGVGIAVRTAADTWTLRQILGTTGQITVTNGAGAAGPPTVSISDNAVLPGTGSVVPPSGTTAQRPGTPTNGATRWNTTLSRLEYWDAASWVDLAGGSGVTAAASHHTAYWRG